MRRGTGLLVVLVAVGSSPAFASVGPQDLEQATAAVEQARAAAGEAGIALAEARAAEERQRALLGDLVGELADEESRLREARRHARLRVRSLYIDAGNHPGAITAAEGGLENAAVRAAYAAAVQEADQEAVILLAAAVEDRERRREQVRREAAAMGEVILRLSALEAAAGPALAAAEAEYERLRAAWEAQEAERLRREIAAAAATTTVPAGLGSQPEGSGGAGPAQPPPAITTSSTTTTTRPTPAAGSFSPMVERWRSLVASYFPAELVDQALAIIACESLGDPAVINPISGTAGLFQHHPRYWPERTAAAGFPGAPAEDPEANVAAAAWLVDESVLAGLDPWFFWACRP